jgi:hypothetical protein
MSLVISATASVFVAGFLYSAYKYAIKVINNSIVYKDTPELLRLYKEQMSMYEKSKSQGCYGDMGRLMSSMVKIEKEINIRSENTREVHCL